MPDRHNELELLSLIEGELDAQASASLRKRLAGDQRATSLVEEMAADRIALRSMPHPELPMDFLAAIEPMLARPMLIESVETNGAVFASKPGAFRREYRKRTRRVRWDRIAIAAVIMLALLAGIWAAVNGLSGGSTQSNDITASNDVSNAPTATGANQLAVETDSMPVSSHDGTVHHYRPAPLPADVSGPRLADASAPMRAGNSEPGPLVAASFALVIHTGDTARAEQAVQVAASDLGEQGALVRNFSFAEAQKLAEEWRLANAGSAGSNDPRVASVGSAPNMQWKTPAELKVLADRVRQQLKKLKPAGHQADGASSEPSGQIVGVKTLAPTLEQQLDYSSRGASYTLAVPIAQMNALIERLSLADGQSTALRMLPEHQGLPESTSAKTPDAWQPLLLWLTDGPKARQEIERISKSQPDAIVLVPIVLTQAAKASK